MTSTSIKAEHQLKATDLRIGNIVSYKGKQYPIGAVTTETAVLDDGKFLISAFVYQLSGIPLDESWLVRFGFEHYQHIWYLKEDSDFGVEFLGKSAFKSYFKKVYLKEIKHVHELQNLFFMLEQKELAITPDK